MAFNGRFVLNVADFATKLGADYTALIALSGQSEAALAQPETTVTREVYNTIVESALRATGDRCLGLHMGEGMSLSAAGLIGQITQTSATVHQALEYCCTFANLGCSELPMQLEPAGDHYKISLRTNPLWAGQSFSTYRHTAEGNLVFTLREFQALTRKGYHPAAVHLPWSDGGDLEEYQRIFRAPLVFNHDEIALLLHRTQVEQPIVTADFELLRILVAHAEQKSAQLRAETGFVTTVRQSMVQLVRPAFPSMEEVARYLNLSTRTLQRRLRTEACSYQQLLSELRHDFALNYLRRADHSISDVAYLLGYADTSAFSRAFKRWEGTGPLAWREIQAKQAALTLNDKS